MENNDMLELMKKIQSMKIVAMETDKLIPYERNNKIHDETQVNRIANSIKEFGFTNPILITKENIIINGHGRLEGAKKLGMQKVPCIIADGLTDKQIKKLRILDNKLNESERNLANLKTELDDLDDFNFGDLEYLTSDLFPEFETPEFDENEYEDRSSLLEDRYEILLKFSSAEEQQVMYENLKEMGGFLDIKIL